MATVLKPRGRMTKPLVTPYEVGDTVLLVGAQDFERVEAGLQVGDIGVIRRITIAEPNDGDRTFLLFDVEWARAGQRFKVQGDEIAAIASRSRQDAEAHLLRRVEEILGNGSLYIEGKKRNQR